MDNDVFLFGIERYYPKLCRDCIERMTIFCTRCHDRGWWLMTWKGYWSHD